MLHARRQSTAELQQQHVDRLNRHTIHTTFAGMANANGPTARATVNSTSWWWGQEQRVVLNFVDADTTQKAMGATSAQIDFVCVICTSNSSTAAVASLYLPLSLFVSLKKNQTTPRPSEHPPVMGKKMSKRSGGIKRLQIQNHFMAFKQVPRCR